LVTLIAVCALFITAAGAQAARGASAKAAKGSNGAPGSVAILSQTAFSNGCVGDVSNLNHPSCTANDVRLTSIVSGTLVLFGNCSGSQALCEENADCPSGQTCNGKGCSGATGDTVTFEAVGRFVAGPQRYDVGLYIETDEDSDLNGAKFGSCTRFAFDNGEGSPALPDLDGDDCGDVSPNSTYEVSFGPVTIPCIDKDGDDLVDINHCETWAQRVNEIDCHSSEDVRAGTGSKCFCGLLAGACIALPDTSDCTRDVCEGTCQSSSGGGSHTVCADNGDCSVSGETCQGITLKHISDTTVECRPSAGDCDVPETCAADGSCPTDAFKSSSFVCRAKDGVCDVEEKCTGTSADCPADGVAGTSVQCRASDGSSCDPPEFCDGTNKTCPGDVCLGNISHP
jgi:hypothetical protein